MKLIKNLVKWLGIILVISLLCIIDILIVVSTSLVVLMQLFVYKLNHHLCLTIAILTAIGIQAFIIYFSRLRAFVDSKLKKKRSVNE